MITKYISMKFFLKLFFGISLLFSACEANENAVDFTGSVESLLSTVDDLPFLASCYEEGIAEGYRKDRLQEILFRCYMLDRNVCENLLKNLKVQDKEEFLDSDPLKLLALFGAKDIETIMVEVDEHPGIALVFFKDRINGTVYERVLLGPEHREKKAMDVDGLPFYQAAVNRFNLLVKLDQ